MEIEKKRILKNTLLLYIREAITLLISLYSSRILLQQLGVDDFGLYGLIGSILLLFNSLRALFSTSIQRFINIEKGKGNTDNINEIFSIGIIIHACLSILFLVAVEIGGFICIPQLNIPASSLTSAYWVLHFSILASVVTIMTVPYDALIIANEKFNAFAVLSIIESILKLIIIYLLIWSPISKVVVYSALMFAVSLIIRMANAIYCSHAFKKESHFKFVKHSPYYKEMTSFAGWQFFGNTGYSIMNAGLNFIINILGGVAVNAARTIAYQVLNAVQRFTGNINLSFQPQSMMLYSQNDIDKYNVLMFMNSKLTVTVTSILGFTLAVLAPSILRCWLNDVPEYAVSFVQAIFLYAIIRSLHAPIGTLFKASGKIKKYQLVEFVMQVLNIPLSCDLLYLNYPYYSIFIIMSIIETISLLAKLWIAKCDLNFDIYNYGRNILLRVLLLLFLLIGAFVLFAKQLNSDYSFLSTIIKAFTCIICSSVLALLTIFSMKEIKKMLSLLTIKR